MPEDVPIEHRHVVANGFRCHALEAGSGPPLVLLHGTAIDSAALTYGPSLERLAAHHRVLALDWPGYGRSEHPRALPTMDDTVALLEAFLDAMGLSRVHLAGFSMGAAVGLGFALRSPERVATLTAIGAYGLDAGLPVPVLPYLAMRVPWLGRSVTWGLRRSRILTGLVLRHVVFSDGRLVNDALVREVHEQLRAPEAERSFVDWLRGELRPFALGTSYAENLGDLRVPTLLLHGQNDRVIPVRKAEVARERIPDARLVRVPGCGHWVPREAPEVFRSELLGFTRGRA